MIRQGQVLYTTDLTDPVVLLYGSVPDWRALGVGVTGADVTQLNHDLANLGYADSADISALGWDYFSWETKAAVEALEQVTKEYPGSPPVRALDRVSLAVASEEGAPKCRTDHRLKQHPRWNVDQLPDGTLRWTTPSGRQYTTEPTRYPI